MLRATAQAFGLALGLAALISSTPNQKPGPNGGAAIRGMSAGALGSDPDPPPTELLATTVNV
jgi:hypothetical protein